MRMRTRLYGFLVIISFCMMPFLAQGQETTALAPAGSALSEVKYEEGKLSMRVNKVPIEYVLHMIAKETKIPIRFYEDPQENVSPVTLDFTDQPLEKALKRLLKDYNHAFIYEKKAKGAQTARIKEIHLFPLSGKRKGLREIVFPPDMEGMASLSIAELIKRLEDPNPFVRQEAALLLFKNGDKSAIEPLKKLIMDKDDNVSEIGLRGYLALSKRFGQDRDDFQLLVDLLKNDAFLKKDMAIQYLPGIAQTGAQKQQAEELLCKIAKEQDPLLYKSALGALGLMAGKHSSGGLVEELFLTAAKSTDQQTRLIGYSGLGKIMDARAVDALMDGLDSKDQDTQSICLSLLTQKDDPEINKGLVDRMASGTVSADLMKAIPNNKLDLLSQAWKSAQAKGNDSVKKDILNSLGGNPEASSFLKEAAKDKSPTIRATALGLLSQTYDPESVDFYLDSIKDPDPEVRKATITNLRNYYDQPGVKRALESSASDPDKRVQTMAKQALSDLEAMEKTDKGSSSKPFERPKETREPVSEHEQIQQEIEKALQNVGQ